MPAREDIAMWGNGFERVKVFGVPAEDPDQELTLVHKVPAEQGPGYHQGTNPLLIAVNPDDDSTVLEFLEHRYLLPIADALGPAWRIESILARSLHAHHTQHPVLECNGIKRLDLRSLAWIMRVRR